MKGLFLLIMIPFFTGCMLLPQPEVNEPSRRLPTAVSDLDNLEMLLLNEQQPIASQAPDADAEDQLRLGMPKQFVKRYFGRPNVVEVAGNPVYGNERWIYERKVSTLDGYYTEKKVIYFEGGRIVGWETK